MAQIKTKSTGKPQFEDKDYDVSINACCWAVCCPLTYGLMPYSTTLHLDAEEVTKKDVSLCGKAESKRPYGELGSVERGNCCCFVAMGSSFGGIQPGCGCDAELVDEIVAELKARQRGRGDTGQIERQEATMEAIAEINEKLDKIMDHLKMERS